MSKFMSTSLFSCLLLFLHCSLAVAKSSQPKYASAKVDGNNTLQTQWLSDEALDENEPPPIPATLSLNPSATTIRLTWTPPKTTKVLIRGYTIGWGVGFPDVDTKSVDARQRSFVLENLKPSHQYVVSLRAYNNAGDGEPTYESSMTKIEDDPDPVDILPPIGLKIEVLSSTTVILSWTDTLPRGYSTASDGRFYTVQYSSNPHAANPKYKFINSTNLNTMIDDLKPFTQYEFAVKVTKGRQDSTWSMSVINTTQEAAPSSPPRDMTIVPSDGDPSEINIHWQPPKQPNGRITGYLIFYTTDNTKSDRDWAFEGVTGDKLTAELKGLLPDTTYYFKIQARNLKGYGPLSAEVSFRTMLLTYSARVTDGKSISTHTLYIIIAGISVVTILLLLVVSILLCKSKRAGGAYGRKPKGYIAAATSPRGKGSLKSKGSTRELNPPDLWIHHEQMELKALEKNHKDNMDGSLNSTPLNRNFAEPISAIEPLTDTLRKGGNQYMHDVLYDDVAKGPNSPTETTISFVSGTARRTVRAKPIMIPVDANAHNISSGINFEASTGLSRPVYPRTQLNVSRGHNMDDHGNLHLYDPVTSSPLQMGLGSQLSNNISYSAGITGSEMMTGSPNTNTLSKRSAPGQQHSLRSFSTPAGSLKSLNQPKHIAVRPQLITSPLKKSPLNGTPGKGLPHIVTPTSRFMKDDDAMSTYSTEELNQEMANLEGIMKDLNAITASEFEMNN